MTVTWAFRDPPLKVSSAVVLRCQITVSMWQMQPWSSKLPLRTLLPLELLWAETSHSNQPLKLLSWRKIQQRSSSEWQLLLCIQDVKSHIFKSFFLHNALSLPPGTLCLSTFICLSLSLSHCLFTAADQQLMKVKSLPPPLLCTHRHTHSDNAMFLPPICHVPPVFLVSC